MVFHMVDRLIGREAFLAALKRVYAAKQFQQASWSDFFAAFAAESGLNLDRVQEQWLNRTGAPELVLDQARRKGNRILLELSQDEPLYDLQVPILVSTSAGEEEHIVHLTKLRDEFELQVPDATSIVVDPAFHLFRRLDPAEIEPTLNQVLGEEAPLFVMSASEGAAMNTDPASNPGAIAAREFATAFTESEAPDFHAGEQPPRGGEPDSDRSSILLIPSDDILQEWSPPELTVTGGYVFIDGKRYSLKEYSLVFTAAKPGAASVTDLVVVCRDVEQLPALAVRLGHYGKYSWLLFPTGQGRALRGNWYPPASPLAATFSD
jgi:hypothetical protein